MLLCSVRSSARPRVGWPCVCVLWRGCGAPQALAFLALALEQAGHANASAAGAALARHDAMTPLLTCLATAVGVPLPRRLALPPGAAAALAPYFPALAPAVCQLARAQEGAGLFRGAGAGVAVEAALATARAPGASAVMVARAYEVAELAFKWGDVR